MIIKKPKEWLLDIRSLGFASIIHTKLFSIFLEPNSFGLCVNWKCDSFTIQILCFVFYFDFEEVKE